MSKFANACVLSYNEWVATIPIDLPDPEYSKRHIRRMNALKNKMRGDVYHVFTTKAIKVMLVAAVLFALLLTAFVIPSSREFIIDNFNICSRYQMTTENLNSVDGEITVGYIPDGYELEYAREYDKHIVNCYSLNQNKYIVIQKYSSAIEIDFDTETGNPIDIVVNGTTYTYCEDANKYCNLVWSKNDYIYRINGELSKDEMFKIAETVK